MYTAFVFLGTTFESQNESPDYFASRDDYSGMNQDADTYEGKYRNRYIYIHKTIDIDREVATDRYIELYI